MKFRALSVALLAAALMTGCSKNVPLTGAAMGTSALRAHDAPAPGVDPAPFLDAAKQAFDLANKNTNAWRNATLVSIEGHGLDQSGKLVPLLGGNWTFKFWANKVEDGKMDTDFSLINVIKHVEGPLELQEAGETRETDIVRALDPSKLSTPTQIVPFAIRLGLKVNRAGAGYNFYDVTYNGFYANPASADANVADVVSYYQNSTIDGLHIPADAGLLPIPAAAPAAPAAPPKANPAPAPAPKKMSPMELTQDQSKRSRQHTL
ncbi:MAG: hypothetical protein JWM80_5544 [Cyanobacteria bacterium RYN_339]|nr:hypothetical protein [Cyanobacteria bacterium RYN_339]